MLKSNIDYAVCCQRFAASYESRKAKHDQIAVLDAGLLVREIFFVTEI